MNVCFEITTEPGGSLEARIEHICLEQSVELPRDTVPADIQDTIVGKPLKVDGNRVWIGFHNGSIGGEITQFLNVLFGNISLLDGIRIVDIDWETLPPDLFGGPSFGMAGMRRLLDAPTRALSCTALKPMGTSAPELGRMAYEFAKGGIDLIKDDHGLADQPWAPFQERLEACAEGVARANRETGYKSLYVPHITGPGEVTERRFEAAREAGAGAVMVCPHLTAPDVQHRLARRSDALPILAHPAFSGGLVRPGHGFSRPVLYGALWRALAADFAIYPNTGGRFTYSLDDCLAINAACRAPMKGWPASIPTPGGGMQRASIPQWLQTYGADTCFLIGGSLYQHPGGIRAAAAEIRTLLESVSA
jgi:ribulose-bisphosphate carboxylase large chain